MVKYLIVSGIRDSENYDEATVMRDELVARGVPAKRDLSRLSAATGPGLRSSGRATSSASDASSIVSQPDHLERALFLARHIGIEAWGVRRPG